MSADLFKNCFFHDFVPNVKKYLTEKGLPLKAMLLIDNAPTHPIVNEMRSGDIFVKFLPPNVTCLLYTSRCV